MSVNNMTFEDLAAVIGEIQGQATNGESFDGCPWNMVHDCSLRK